MDYAHIITQMVSIFALVMVGFVASKRGLWTGDLDRKLSVFILNVSMPALILASVSGKIAFERSEILMLVLVAFLNYGILLLCAYLVPLIWRVNSSRKGLLRFMLAFGNVGFIGYPVADAVFGPKGVFCASVINIPSNLLIFTIGIAYINGGKISAMFKPRVLFSPCMVASLLAVLIALSKVEIPTPVGNWFHLLGDMTIPSALLIIGSSLSHIPVKDMMGNAFVYGATALRLLVLPLVVFGVFRLLGIEPFITAVAVVLSAMPVATNGIIFCLQYGKDERVMTQGLFVTTLFSVITIPLIAMLI